jgi:hypothetical protein
MQKPQYLKQLRIGTEELNIFSASRQRCDFHLEVSFLGTFQQLFNASGYFVSDPIRSALSTNQGRNVPNHDHTKPELGSEGGCSCSLASTTKGTDARTILLHDFLQVRKSA